MTAINFIKMNGTGNDFVIIDARISNPKLTPEKIAQICKRSNIGCDQLILLKNSTAADIFMDIYNSDGSSSGACGNATRCIASLIMEEKKRSEVTIETIAGILPAKREGQMIAVNMGPARLGWQEIPLASKVDTELFNLPETDLNKFKFSAVNMGNPHAVTFLTQEIPDEEFFKIGPTVETHNFFPQKTNVEFVTVLSPTHLKVRVWERGAGETAACGTGACAVAVAAIRRGLVLGRKITVTFKGGNLVIDWQKDGSVIMSGGFQKIYSGVIDENFLA